MAAIQSARTPKQGRPAEVSPDTPVRALRGVGDRTGAALERLGIVTVADLLTHFPRRYQSRDQAVPIRHAPHGQWCTLLGTLRHVESRRARSGIWVTSATLEDGSGVAKLVFFNQRYLQTTLERLRGRELLVYGLAERNRWDLTLKNVEWEEATEASETGPSLQPVYPLTAGVFQKTLRRLVRQALPALAPRLPDAVPEELRRRRGLVGYEEALWGMHFPETAEQQERARRRLAYEEFLALQVALARRRSEARRDSALPLTEGRRMAARLEESLPFPLTGAQRRVIDQILSDLEQAHPMGRLLQGDVGSGKTLVAAAALLAAHASGAQSVLMAPTEILAEQHFRVLHRLLSPLGVPLALLTGSVGLSERARIYELSETGRLSLVVGTHALIQEGLRFARLGLAVVDEQHRFGVEQRALLQAKGESPHLLVMTATPIPRTLALTVYGDLDVSILDELPPGRKPVRTHLKPASDRLKVYEAMRGLLHEGRQAYVICPLVDESEKLQAQAATRLAEELRRRVFPELRVGLLHGQMSAAEKDSIMQAFHRGEVRVLVSTTVVEVGVDVPNATIVVVEDAERFGLAQLHQLRGRVGRGEHQSYCILLANPTTDEARERLQVMAETQDGFRISEEDLRIRGPGELAGTRQAGLPAFRVASVITDLPLLEQARADAQEWLARDPSLSRPESEGLAAAAAGVEAEVPLLSMS